MKITAHTHTHTHTHNTRLSAEHGSYSLLEQNPVKKKMLCYQDVKLIDNTVERVTCLISVAGTHLCGIKCKPCGEPGACCLAGTGAQAQGVEWLLVSQHRGTSHYYTKRPRPCDHVGCLSRLSGVWAACVERWLGNGYRRKRGVVTT